MRESPTWDVELHASDPQHTRYFKPTGKCHCSNLLTFEGVCFASISKKTPLSKLSFAFVSLALPLLVRTRQNTTVYEGKYGKIPIPEPFWYRIKETQSGTGMLRYRTEMQDAGMLMPAESASMPMPSYAIL